MLHDRDVRIFLKGDAKEAYLELKKRNDKEAETILRSFERIKEVLRDNPQFGQPIRKELIPEKMNHCGIKAAVSRCKTRESRSNHAVRMIYVGEGCCHLAS